MRADIGIALDGDADRVIIIDEKGKEIDGDQLMALIGETWAADGLLRGGGIVATIMSNLGLERFLARSTSRWPVPRWVTVMWSSICAISASMSAANSRDTWSFPTSERPGRARGCAAGAGLREAHGQDRERSLPPLRAGAAAPEERALFGRLAAGQQDGQEAIAAAESDLKKNGRLVIRPSGTEPLIRVMAEGDDRGQIEQIVNDLTGVIAGASNAA